LKEPVPVRVLVIDEIADDRMACSRSLDGAGFAVEAAGTTAAALDSTGPDGYGAIILDHGMLGGSTGGILTRLQDRYPGVPVLVALRLADAGAARNVLRQGAADYLLKPVDAEELRVRVGRIAELGQVQAQAETELRKKEDELRAANGQLLQADRLAGIGALAAGVAHELNNPLATVALRVEGLLARTPPDDPRRHALEVVEQEVERMAGLVSNLLQFSRSGSGVSTLDVRAEVSKALDLLSHLFRKGRVQAEPEFAPDVPVLHADRQQLRQVLLNLFANAVDAMPGGGRLTPRVRPGRLPGSQAAVVLEVSDTGAGIPADVLPRVTDPFFTTKDDGKGTGLGLSICRKIVEGHRGVLEIESEVGVGTTVRVTLPVGPPGKAVAPSEST
jgi:signal transduction histidine kinase